MIRGSNLSEDVGTRLIDDNLVFVSVVKAKEFNRSIIRRGDLIFTCWGTINQVGLIDDRARHREYVVSNKQMKFTPDPCQADSLFLYYLFSSPQLQNRIKNESIGSSVPGFNLRPTTQMRIRVPHVGEQRAIARMLGAVDDRIELNRRMNETLEAMARALFKSWFIDFDPVSAKAEGRDPGLPEHVAALFPDSFEKSELGEVPAGWGVGSILEQAQLLSGGTPKTDRPEYWDGAIAWVSAKDVSQSAGSILTTSERRITERGLKESAAQVVPQYSTVVISRGATTGRMVVMGRAMAMNQTCYTLVSTTGAHFALHCQLRHDMDSIVHAGHGSIFNTITTSTFAASRTVLPTAPALKAFDDTVRPLFERALCCVDEIATLRTLPRCTAAQAHFRGVTCAGGGTVDLGGALMTNVWSVRADFGRYTGAFVAGGYVAIGWIHDVDLCSITTKDQLYPLYKQAHPNDTSNLVIGQQVGQIARFLLEIQPGDYVITPAAYPDTDLLYYGQMKPPPSYFYAPNDPVCPYPHRRHVDWAKHPVKRSDFSVPFQNTSRSSLTVFAFSQHDEFMAAIGKGGGKTTTPYDAYQVVLHQILELDDKEFEFLVGHLLTALGFEGSQVTGKSGDGGVDATGELDVASLAKVKVYVQAKRYQLGAKISASTVKKLRQSIPNQGQGGFITTADFQDAAAAIATEPGFPRIGLINGHRLVDLLVEHWNDIPKEFQDRLGLKTWLVKA